MIVFGSMIPEYVTRAREAREVCEKMFPFQRDVCRANYDRALAEGRKQAAPPALPTPPYVPTATELKKRADEDEALRARQLADCKANLEPKIVEYKKLMAARRYWPASLALRVCANVLEDQQIKSMVSDAEVKHFTREIEDSKTARLDRIRFINMLLRDYPSQGAKYKNLLDKLEREGTR